MTILQDLLRLPPLLVFQQIIDTFSIVKANINIKCRYWEQKGLKPGSEEALMYDEEVDEDE